jgi:uncharacterized protein (TIGR02246 family)
MFSRSTKLFLTVAVTTAITVAARMTRSYKDPTQNDIAVAGQHVKDGVKVNSRSMRKLSSSSSGKGKKGSRSARSDKGSAQPITPIEVRLLFNTWSKALETRNAGTVASLYSKQPVLLPTLSNIPRTNFTMIKDYFEEFLLKRPRGVIESGNIFIGDNWAQDAGIYVFTLGIDNSIVRARYSFVYIWENSQWKISLHHSSKMPSNDG